MMNAEAGTPRAPHRRRKARDMRGDLTLRAGAAALAATSALLAPFVARAASFDLADGGRVEGEITTFGARYFVVSDNAGGHLVVDRAQLLAVSVASPHGPVEGPLVDWSQDGFLIETEVGLVRVKDGEEPSDKPDAQAPVAEEAAPEQPVTEATDIAPDQADIEAAAGSDQTDAQKSAAQPESETEQPPSVESQTPIEAEAQSAAVEPLASAEAADASPSEETIKAAQTDAAVSGAETPPPLETAPTSEPQSATAAPIGGAGPLVIATDSPETDATPDDLQALTDTPETRDDQVAAAAQTDEPMARQTTSATSPTSPNTPTLSAPAIQQPQLTTKEPEEPRGDDGNPQSETVVAALPTDDAIDGPPSAAPASEEAPVEQAEASPSVEDRDAGATLEAPRADPAPEDFPPPLEAPNSESIDPRASDPILAPGMDPAPSQPASSRPEGGDDAPPASDAAPLETPDAEIVIADAAIGADGVVPSIGAGTQIKDPLLDSAPTAIPLDPDDTEAFALEYRMGALGPPAGQEGRITCARLGGITAPPAPPAAGRLDPGALAIEIGPDAPESLAFGGVAAFLGLEDRRRLAALDEVPGETTAFLLEPADQRLITPERAIGLRMSNREEMLQAGAADIAIIGGAPPPGAIEAGRARLIAFDALAFIAHPEAAQGPLSITDLSGLFSGKLSEWSMIDPRRTGEPLLLLPPDGAPALTAALDYSGARRAKPAAARRIERAASRAEAAKITRRALTLTLWSTLDEAEPVALGARSGGVAPSFDTIRSGAYPLVWPIYAVLPEEPAHPTAIVLFEFLSSPAGQRAIYEAGLAPVAACDPSTCSLEAPDLDEARERLTSQGPMPPLVIDAPAAVAGPQLAELAAPADPRVAPTEFVESIAGFIASVEPGADISATPLQLVARGGPTPGQSEAQAQARSAYAMVRAEAAALALRCAGLQVERIVLDPTPLSGAFGGEETLSIDLLPL